MATKRRDDRGSSLLKQGDLGGGQGNEPGRPRGTAPVGRFAAEGAEDAPGGGGPWPTAPGEASAACEDGFPGSDQVRRADLVEAGLFPGVLPEEPQAEGQEGEGVRGALYEGPERRKDQADSACWEANDRRSRPFTYAHRQEV